MRASLNATSHVKTIQHVAELREGHSKEDHVEFLSLDGTEHRLILTEIEGKYSRIVEADHRKPLSVHH
jgi:VCBS repeat-containing protein